MTREEIERARELLEIHRRTSHMSCTVERGELVGLVMNHVEELLSLAEEARWRSVTEEPPELFATVLVPADENNDHVAAYLSHSGVWCACETESPLMPSEVPTHWRPLPKGPER